MTASPGTNSVNSQNPETLSRRSTDSAGPNCPVCKVSFRGKSKCSRCGADLSRLMLIVARSFQLREQARRALLEARYHTAYDLASKAQSLHYTDLGRKMMLVARVLDMVSVRR